MRKYLFLFISAVMVFGASAQKNGTTDKRLAGLDTALTKLLKDWNTAGFAVAVIEKNKLIYSNGFGYRDYENKKPVTPNTLFAIGSCTKAFTASLIGMLEKEGKVSLDQKATTYLPALHFYNDKMNDNITLRDMMCHRTGLPRHDFSWYLFNTASRDTLLQRIQYLEPNAALREKWQYNNFMFLLQGMITEKITGRSWEQNIKEKIFSPLGMTRSNLSVFDMAKDSDASRGYLVKNDSIIKEMEYFDINGMGPAGSINSSVNEMANWVITWLNNGKYNNKDILPAGYIKNATSSQMIIAAALPEKENPDIHFSNYGLGWFLASYRGHYRVEHGGNIDGFSASTCFFPSDSIGIIVLSNQNNSAVPSIARNMIADRMLKLKYYNWSGTRKEAADKDKANNKAAEKTKTSSRIPGTRPSHPLVAYQGLFSNLGYGQMEIYFRNDSLFGRAGKDSMWLRHYHYDIFEIKGFDKEDGIDTSEGGLRINFHSGESGMIESLLMALEPTVKPLEFLFTPKPKSVAKEELEKYTGDYELAGMTIKVYLKGNVLYMSVPGQADYETIPLGDRSFKLKTLDGFSIQFELNEQNEVVGLTSHQPNGIFKAIKKK